MKKRLKDLETVITLVFLLLSVVLFNFEFCSYFVSTLLHFILLLFCYS